MTKTLIVKFVNPICRPGDYLAYKFDQADLQIFDPFMQAAEWTADRLSDLGAVKEIAVLARGDDFLNCAIHMQSPSRAQEFTHNDRPILIHIRELLL